MDAILLPPELAEQIPGFTNGVGYGPAAVAYVKFVAPWQKRRWYVTLYHAAERFCWTKYVGPDGAALMGVRMSTLENLQGPNGEQVSRDTSFISRPLDECEPECQPRIIRGEEWLGT